MTGTPVTAAGARAPGDRLLVHGLGHDLAEADWPPLDDDEVGALLARYRPAGDPVWSPARVRWRSPRPLSAAALVEHGGATLFVKRHDPRVRTADQLAVEHAFARHLARAGLRVPQALADRDGATAVTLAGGLYEVLPVAPGVDAYRDAPSWTPYRTDHHARAAGAALATFHRAAAGFGRPARPFGVLSGSCTVVTAADPIGRIGQLAAARPGLAGALRGRPWRHDLDRHLLPALEAAAPLVARLTPQWAHGDWHPSNLTWTDASDRADVVAVLDLGLADRTSAAHDVAVALERSVVSWLDLDHPGGATADLAATAAFLDGYAAVRPLAPLERAAVAALLPVVHLDFALSELEYFSAVLASPDRARLTYDTYLVGHARFFSQPGGRALLDLLRRRSDAP